MKTSSAPIIADEPRSLTPEPNTPGNRTPRRSHVSIASSKRPSMNAGVIHPNKAKQGMFRRAVPQMPRILACICFGLNLVLPGTGMSANFIDRNPRRYVSLHRNYLKDNHIEGLLFLSLV